MGNCLDSSAKVDTAQSSHATSVMSISQNYLSKVGMQKHQVDLGFFGNNNSDPGSPTDSEERSKSLVESVSISALFPANKSDTDGSSESNEIPPIFSYCPISIASFFSPARSSVSENPPIRANEPTSLSISLLFPPTMSETETNDSCSGFDEAVEARFSYSIVSLFPPAKSQTDSVSENDNINPTDPSIPASARPTRRTIQTKSFRDPFRLLRQFLRQSWVREFSELAVSKFASKTSHSSAPSSLTIQTFSETSNASSLPTPRSEGEILSSPNLKAFTFNELKNATRNFCPDSLLGEGGFGYVFKGWIDEHTFSAAKPGSGMAVAVKKLKSQSFQGHKEWLTEVNYLGQFHHPNLVKLIGYCLEGENWLLVYEFMPKGSLDNHLFRRRTQSLSWAIRIKVATGAARGLCFLHEAKSQVIYRDFKSSNILLDAEFNSKFSDLGLAKAGPIGDRIHVFTHGYAAPEYVATGRLTAKSDVYSFGVVLLELLSGRRAVDKSKVGIGQNLVDWAKPYLGDKRKLFRIMDTKLEGQYPQTGAYTAATLALQCLRTEPKVRPKMVEVLATLEQLENPKNAGRTSQSEQHTGAPVRKSPMHPHILLEI